MGATLLSLIGDNAALDDVADQLVAVVTDQGLHFWGPWGSIYRGWVKVKNGDIAEEYSCAAVWATYRAAGAELWMSHCGSPSWPERVRSQGKLTRP